MGWKEGNAVVDPDQIVIRGAKEHNLKNIDVTIPRHRLVVLTGVSGSGKSSLAFDTLYAEGQRRYVESLSAYARQFIDQMEKPKVDYIGGLSPAIAIEQKAVSRNPRSTVATVTEIYDYLRVLYARAGTPHCPQCGREVRAQSAQEIVERVAGLPTGTRFQILAPLATNRKGTFRDVFAQARADGFSRVRVDGEIHELGRAHHPGQEPQSTTSSWWWIAWPSRRTEPTMAKRASTMAPPRRRSSRGSPIPSRRRCAWARAWC